MHKHETVLFHLALLSYFTIASQLIHMLILEVEGKPIKHKFIGREKTSDSSHRNETPFRTLDHPKKQKRYSLIKRSDNPKHFSKDEFRRALDVDIDVKQSRSKGNHRDDDYQYSDYNEGGYNDYGHQDEVKSEKMVTGFYGGPPSLQKGNQTCKECVKEQQEIFKELSEKLMINEENAKSGVIKPAYKCDAWEPKSRTCWLNRNIGDTVTFILSFSSKLKRSPQVIWKQEFHERGKEERKNFILKRENPTWNVVIGSKGHEMRVSPISEIDVDPNLFSAALAGEDDEELNSGIFFRIRLIPNDLGFVYPGETLVLNMASYIALPLEGLRYVWYLEKDSEFDALPSNMKSSPSGAVLTISELRKEQEGIMTCSVYSNLAILVAKKRFLIKELSSNDILMSPTNRSHSFNGKRNSQHSIKKRNKTEDKIEKSLKQLEPKKSDLAASKEGFEVDYNMDREGSSFIGDLLESPPVDVHKPLNLFNNKSSKSNQKSVKLPPPASAVKMDAIQQERKIRQNYHEFHQQQQHSQYQQEPQYQQHQSQNHQQEQPQYEQQPQHEQQLQYAQQHSQYEQQLQQQQNGQQQQPQYQQQQQPQYQQQQQPQYQQQQPQYEQQQQPQYQQQQQPQYEQQQQPQYQQQQPQYQQQQPQYEQQQQPQYEQQQQPQYEQQQLQHDQQSQQQQYEQQKDLEYSQLAQRKHYEEQQQRYKDYQVYLKRLLQEQQRVQQEHDQRLQQEQQQRLQQEELQRLQQEEQQRLQQEQQLRLQQEQQQRLQQEQQQRLQQEQQQRLQQEQEQQQLQQQQQLIYSAEGQESLMEQDAYSKQREQSAKQNLSPSLAKYSMGQINPFKESEYAGVLQQEQEKRLFQEQQERLKQEQQGRLRQKQQKQQIHHPNESENGKGESFLNRQRHSTELISPARQMVSHPEQQFPDYTKANSGQIQNLPDNIPDNLREGLNTMPIHQSQIFPSNNRLHSEKIPYNQKEYSAQNFPSNHGEQMNQNSIKSHGSDSWSSELLIENREIRPEDEMSKIISRCRNDRECAGNAACVKSQTFSFCRCLPNFHGNGISCWEDMIPRNTMRQLSNVKIQQMSNPGHSSY